MKGIAEWLASLGLGEYSQRFADNAIDLSVVRDLTEQDLKDLGVLLGHRRKILRAIAELDGLAPSPIETATEPAVQDTAERRHLTVMLCDLVGSTALSVRLDPEDMRAVMDAYHAACARIVLTYEGFLAEFRGDGILAYFGYPRAHEDDAERTVRAGLEIIAAVARLETRAAEPLAVRIGVATGLVVVGNLSAKTSCGSILWSGTRRTLQLALNHWPGLARSSSPAPRAGCSAIFSVCATSAGMRSRVWPSRSRRGRLRVCRPPRAASRRSARGG